MERKVDEARDICNECKAHGYCIRGGRIFMTWQGRFILFMLSSLCTVIIPAVMLNLYNTLSDLMPQAEPFIIALCLIPLVLVLLVCFGGLYYSIFKIKQCPKLHQL